MELTIQILHLILNLGTYLYKIIIDGTNLYVGGYFGGTSFGLQFLFGAVKLNKSTGARDATWVPNCDGEVYDMVKDGTSIYMVGQFELVGGATRKGAAKVNDTTGALDGSWNPNLACTNHGYADMWNILMDGSDLYIYGEINSINGVSVNNVVRVNKTTGASTFPSGTTVFPQYLDYHYGSIVKLDNCVAFIRTCGIYYDYAIVTNNRYATSMKFYDTRYQKMRN